MDDSPSCDGDLPIPTSPLASGAGISGLLRGERKPDACSGGDSNVLLPPSGVRRGEAKGDDVMALALGEFRYMPPTLWGDVPRFLLR
mmetsp:Transcript_12361/g.35921  ORF Transcript_12361/g.35921 Transcript_12361/m.35921 type:complete len:87 (+) Transcript_12361:86-346(+)